MNGLQNEIKALEPWFHNIHLPDGTQTAPYHELGDFPMLKWKAIAPHLPGDLSSWKAVDVGCNAGFYSVELAKRGAKVTGIDIDEHYLRQAGWIVRQFGLHDKIHLKRMQVYELARDTHQYDISWFMGVFYHLRYPYLALDILARITKKMMVFQTMTMPGDDSETERRKEDIGLFEREQLIAMEWPKMAFIEHRMAGDPTNWWVPNHSAVKAMLRSCGFRIVHRPEPETYICEREREFLPPDDINEQEYRAASGLLYSL